MKLVIISPYQYQLNRGIERFTYSLANQLAKKGVQVTIYTWAFKQAVNWGTWHENVRIRKVPNLRYYRGHMAAFFYRRWLWKDKPDKILLNFLYHGEQLLPSRLHYCYVLHSPASQIPHRYDFIQSKLARFPKLEFIAVSNFVKNQAEKYFGNRRINVIYNGVDIELFKPEKSARKQDGKIRLITTAALEERKGIQHVIRAIGESERKDIIYHVYGGGSKEEKDKLKKIISEYKLARQVTIYEPVSTIHKVLPQYDIYCLLSYGEAFGLGWLEAIACGLPVIVSKHPPYDELVAEPFGMSVNELRPQEILEAIEKLLLVKQNQPELIRAVALSYSWERISEQYLKIL